MHIPTLFQHNGAGRRSGRAYGGLLVVLALLGLSTWQATAASDGSLSDTNIKYFGRWDFSSPSQYVSYWGGAYLKVNFTGTTAHIKLGNTSNFYVSIDDGPWITFTNAGSGTVNLTPTPLAAGTHSLSVAQGHDYDYVFNFQGLTLDSGASTSPPIVYKQLIEFIGDSITAGYTDSQADVSDYAWVCAENLNCEHTQIAYPGVNLVSGYTGVGQDVQYFKEQSFAYANSPNWNFTNYTAQVVVINLGQNDGGANGVPTATFQNDYTNFLANIRAVYPNADIFCLRVFLGFMAAQTEAAVAARNAAGDLKVHYVDTTGWLTNSDYNDGVHPSDSGQIKVAARLQPILAPYVTASLPNGVYKLLNGNSGLVLDATGQNTTNGTPIEQWSYNGGDNQLWAVTNSGAGEYVITGVQSGRVLDVTGQSLEEGTDIQLYDANGGDNQKWIITPTIDGFATLQGVQSGFLMEVLGDSTAPGALIDQWPNNGGDNQQWIFQKP